MTSTYDSWNAAQTAAPGNIAWPPYARPGDWEKGDPAVLEGDAAIARARKMWGDQCPATTRVTASALSVAEVGVQCKYAKGHDGDHAGHGGFSRGDVFWPQEPASETHQEPAPQCYGA